MHKQIKIDHGVYITDFRLNSQLKGIDQSTIKNDSKDVGLLLDKINNNQSKIKQLIFTIDAIQQEQGWETDNDFLQAIDEDYQKIIKFSGEMKQWIVQLATTKYKPENDKIQQLIDANRITNRENQIQMKFNQFLNQYGRYIPGAHASEQVTKKQLVEVSSESEKDKQQVQKKQDQKNKEDKDQGIYL